MDRPPPVAPLAAPPLAVPPPGCSALERPAPVASSSADAPVAPALSTSPASQVPTLVALAAAAGPNGKAEANGTLMEPGDKSLAGQVVPDETTPLLPPPISAPLPTAASARIPALDLTRGIIILAMSLDHARKYLSPGVPLDSHRAGAEEDWRGPLPDYAGGCLAVFAARAVTHIAAPGFFFLMGLGNVLFARSRIARGWSTARMVRHGAVRGGILVALAATVLNDGVMARGANPSEKNLDGVHLSLGVMFALGVNMALAMAISVAALRMTSHTRVTALLSALALAVPLVTEAVVRCYVYNVDNMSSAAATTLMLTFVPDTRGFLQVMYPFVPWLAPTLWGIAYGLATRKMLPKHATKLNTFLALMFFSGFLFIRLTSGYGNIRTPTSPTDPFSPTSLPLPSSLTARIIAFFTVVKYPPSLAFLLVTLSAVHTLVAHTSRAQSVLPRIAQRPVARVLLAFGQSSLFFYLAHVALYFGLGVAVRRLVGREGLTLAVMFPLWAAGLALLFVACERYARFKMATPPESLWRLF